MGAGGDAVPEHPMITACLNSSDRKWRSHFLFCTTRIGRSQCRTPRSPAVSRFRGRLNTLENRAGYSSFVLSDGTRYHYDFDQACGELFTHCVPAVD